VANPPPGLEEEGVGDRGGRLGVVGVVGAVGCVEVEVGRGVSFWRRPFLELFIDALWES